MEFNQLRSFITVSKHGHLTRAAESLHLSQPALSGQIKALEQTLGITLFRRSSSGMALTPSGRLLLDAAERAMAALQEFHQRARGLTGAPTGRLIIGTVLDPATLRVGELLARSMQRYPQIEIELHQVVSHEALTGIRSGTLDASFFFGDQPEADLQCIPLRAITYRVALPVAWTQGFAAESWTSLAERPWIVAPATSSHRQLVMEAFRGRTPIPERLIEADNESVIVNLVESGVGASLVREEIALTSASEGRIALCPHFHLNTTLWLAYPALRDGDPLLRAVLAVLAEVWNIDGRDPGQRPATGERDQTELAV